MATVALPINFIESDSHVRRGRPVIAGTGICVSDIAAAYQFRGETTEEVAANYGLSLAQVFAALAYYYDHKAEIDDELTQEAARIQRAKDEHDSKLGSGV
jgi:uncharacterized protein (DUF433 family)